MNNQEYKTIKDNFVNNLKNYPIIKKHAQCIKYWNNDHASISIEVKHNNKAYYNRFMQKLKEENKNILEYVIFSSNSYSSEISIKFINDNNIVKNC